MNCPANWRLLELQSGRSPTGRAWSGLCCEVTRRRPTAADQERFNKYRRLVNAGVDHATAYLSAMGRESRSEEFMRQLISEGLLTVPA